MADISNAQLKEFCNSSLRTRADILTKMAADLPILIAVYNARDLGTIINDAGPSNFVDDGSDLDGRTKVVGGDVYNIVTLLADLQAFFTSGRIEVLAKWQVNGTD